MSTQMLARLLQSPASIAERLLALRDVLPELNVSCAAADCNDLLDADLDQVRESAEALAEIFWGTDGWVQAVTAHPGLLVKDAAALRACDADLVWYMSQGHLDAKNHARRGDKLLMLANGVSLRRMFPHSRGPQRAR